MAGYSEEILALMEQELPSYFTRGDIEELTHGLFKKTTMANFEAAKTGPKVHYLGRKACYIKSEFIQWLREYASTVGNAYENLSRNDN